jgi:hypothetical protein
MKTMTKTLIATLALAGTVVGGGTASAQPWGHNPGYGSNYGGYGNGYRDPRQQAAINRELVNSTCSGQRGQMMENRLRYEVNRGQIDRWTASRIQTAIDRLQFQERRECRESDFQSARNIGKDYIQLRVWIDQESGRYRGGYFRR